MQPRENARICISNFLLVLFHLVLHICFLEAEESKSCLLSFARYVSVCGSMCIAWRHTFLKIQKSVKGVEPQITDVVGTGNSSQAGLGRQKEGW